MEGRFEHRALIMGFGHRVYKHGDPRADHDALCGENGRGDRRPDLDGDQPHPRRRDAGQKNIPPNLDFPTGPAYYLMGFEIPMFTPIFVASRITGWAAHVIEQAHNNRLIRPLSVYIGAAQRTVPPIAAR